MKWIVYQTTCTVNNKIYIGVHGTTDPDVFDGYIGNGINIYHSNIDEERNSHFRAAVKKYGYSKFIRTTLKVFDNEEDAYKFESLIVDDEFLKREDVYNLVHGGCSGKYAVPRKKVYMYDLDGNFEREFDGVNEAGRFLNPNAKGAGHLPRAIKEGHQYLGHQFSYEKLPFMKKRTAKKPKSFNTINSPKVGRFDKEGNLLETYKNLTECRKAGYTNANKVLQGERDFCKGFTFKYLD